MLAEELSASNSHRTDADSGNISPLASGLQKNYPTIEHARKALAQNAERLKKEFPLGEVYLENDKVVLCHAPHSGETIVCCSISKTSKGYNIDDFEKCNFL